MVLNRIPTIVFLLVSLIGGLCSECGCVRFPKSFLFGTASSAYQIEGAWNQSGKGVGILDQMFHDHSSLVEDGSSADISCDSYHKYREDIKILKRLGVHYYRLSISWPRVLPTGFLNFINPAGVEYYNNLINEILAAGIEPWVTINHFDIPESINKLGGWNNPNIVNYYADYANLIFSLYGDRVRTWFTLNEPNIFCVYFAQKLASVENTVSIGVTEYLCSKHFIQAHARVYRLYRKKFWEKQKGRIALVFNTEFGIAASNSKADVEAAERLNQFKIGLYAHPLVHGDYPQIVIDTVRNYSTIQGFHSSRLPKLKPEEIQEIKGAYDFFAINHYTSVLTRDNRTAVDMNPSFENDMGVITYADPSWKIAPGADWLAVCPQGFRLLLTWLKDTYRNPEIVITEQGYADTGELDDMDRQEYYKAYLCEGLKAIYEDEVRLTAYTTWNLLDDFEFFGGYRAKFGLYHVDFNSPNRTRTPKKSAHFYRKLIATRRISDEYEE